MMYGWIIGLILVVVLIVSFNKGLFGGGANQSGNADLPLDTLKNRYAKGEIDKAEYEERKAELEKSN